ncbi:type II toxin-antitoxin system VapC family toxin [Gloeothece verrucosa]|uniref:PilT protein domain protein n=1 Tax=Gloeothece verrucosa (strain PCC 7822) TaxID=497965 RepID=E0UNT3_GLOV7|nr:type II toxin-antitoxin system VapC family toxin [Gloeothece verrucosa]ADN18613.1 PilT protein domain protein [Gloeothece verrucosa PCC 7822]
MRLLIDTHAFLWFFSGDPKLSNTARILMEDIKCQKLISIATVWEIAIKQSKNKLTLALPIEDYIQQKVKLEDFELWPISLSHLFVISTLPFHHNDPFDRLLIAQTIVEGVSILSRDLAFDSYNIQRIWN